MHLTYPNSDEHKATASTTNAEEAGAPEVTPAMIQAALPFAETTLQEYPIADFSIRLLVEGVLRRAMLCRSHSGSK
jgi:hypothetical protein